MKLKNIFAHLLSFFILTAFIGCMACEFLLHSEIPNHKTEQLSNKKSGAPDLTFLSEEDEDTDNAHDFSFPVCIPAGKTSSEIYSGFFVQNISLAGRITLPVKTPLFIHVRKLRI